MESGDFRAGVLGRGSVTALLFPIRECSPEPVANTSRPIPELQREKTDMSIHKSLKTGSGIGGTRNVLTRYERILQMESEGRFNEEEHSPIGLPKTRVLKVKKRAKKKKEKDKDKEEA